MKREREKERERQTAVGISCAQNGPRDGERTPRRTSPLGCCPILAPTQFIHNRLFQRIILRSTTNLWVLPSGRRVIMRVRCVARRRDAEGQKLWVSFIVRTVSCSPRVRVHVFPFELATTRFSFSSFFLSFFLSSPFFLCASLFAAHSTCRSIRAFSSRFVIKIHHLRYF